MNRFEIQALEPRRLLSADGIAEDFSATEENPSLEAEILIFVADGEFEGEIPAEDEWVEEELVEEEWVDEEWINQEWVESELVDPIPSDEPVLIDDGWETPAEGEPEIIWCFTGEELAYTCGFGEAPLEVRRDILFKSDVVEDAAEPAMTWPVALSTPTLEKSPVQSTSQDDLLDEPDDSLVEPADSLEALTG